LQQVAAYRHLLVPEAVRPKGASLLKRGAVGIALFTLARWVWRQQVEQKPEATKHSSDSG
jgi:hypothetical protein